VGKRGKRKFGERGIDLLTSVESRPVRGGANARPQQKPGDGAPVPKQASLNGDETLGGDAARGNVPFACTGGIETATEKGRKMGPKKELDTESDVLERGANTMEVLIEESKIETEHRP